MSKPDHNSQQDYDFGNYGKSNENDLMRIVTETYLAEHPESSDVTLQERIHAKVIELVDPEGLKRLSKDELQKEMRALVEKLVESENPAVNSFERHQLIEDLLDEILGFGPLDKLMRDPTVGDILVNGANQVYVERHGVLEESPIHFRDNKQLLHVIQRIVAMVGRRVDERSPLVDARLADGSRVNAIIPPLALRGPTLSIRRFSKSALLLDDLLRLNMFTVEMLEFLEAAVKSKLNIIISGGTGSGKTTLLNALSSLIPSNERIVTIEDSAELQLQQTHVVQLEARPANIEGKGEITIRDLVRNSLRMRPDRIIIGECRGREALDMLQAMNTGHEGSMTTLHANSTHDALSRLENMIEMAGVQIPLRSLRDQIANSIDLIIQVDRLMGGSRRVTSVTEVIGMEGEVIVSQDIFRFDQRGVDEQGKAYGAFQATGILPHAYDQIRAYGMALHTDFFRERDLALG